MLMEDIATTENTVDVIYDDIQPHVSSMEEERLNRETLLEVTFIACLPIFSKATT